MANDSGLFQTADDCADEGATYDGWAWETPDRSLLPLYEAKMLWHWNNRLATYEDATQAQLNVGSLPRLTADQLDDPDADVLARYWVDEDAVSRRRAGLVGPGLAVRLARHRPRQRRRAPSCPARCRSRRSGTSSRWRSRWSRRMRRCCRRSGRRWSFDYVARQKLSGTHMTYFIVKQLACPTPATFDEPIAVGGRDAGGVRPPAGAGADLHQPPDGRLRPRRPGPARRIARRRAVPLAARAPRPAHRRARRRDAARLRPVACRGRARPRLVLRRGARYEERDLGEYRTKRLVLAAYDAMADAAATGVPFVSPLDPPPGDGPTTPRARDPDTY